MVIKVSHITHIDNLAGRLLVVGCKVYSAGLGESEFSRSHGDRGNESNKILSW